MKLEIEENNKCVFYLRSYSEYIAETKKRKEIESCMYFSSLDDKDSFNLRITNIRKYRYRIKKILHY